MVWGLILRARVIITEGSGSFCVNGSVATNVKHWIIGHPFRDSLPFAVA